jgi:hypothetical protein
VSTHHSIVVARSATPLPLVPEVRSAFGTFCFNLVQFEEGWQMAEINVRPHQWATVGAGPGPIAAATGAPVLAAWISDIACAQMAAAIPGGPSWTAHLLGGDWQDCEFDHKVMNTLRAPGPKQPPVEHARLAADLAAWSSAAGHTAAVEPIQAVLADQQLLLEHRYRAMIGKLGLGDSVAVESLGWADDRIHAVIPQAMLASWDIPTPWNGRTTASRRSTALVAFLERCDAAEFDPGITDADLAAHAEHFLAIPPDGRD